MAKAQTHKPNQSALYAIRSRKRLASILLFQSIESLEQFLSSSSECYEEFERNGRHIEYPTGKLAVCQKRISKMLEKIERPQYVHSQKGRSYVSNAAQHANTLPLIKTDISQYFPSTTFSHVYRFFFEDMNCAPDVAFILTKLCTFHGHIPTGSTLSNPIAFLANRPLFDDIFDYTNDLGCHMTLLQDDITVSGNAASKKMLNEIRMRIRRWGLTASPKRKKTKTYPGNSPKVVTGVVLKEGQLHLPNRRHKLLADAHKRLKAGEASEVAKKDVILELKGRINEADQINPAAVYQTFRIT